MYLCTRVYRGSIKRGILLLPCGLNTRIEIEAQTSGAIGHTTIKIPHSSSNQRGLRKPWFVGSFSLSQMVKRQTQSIRFSSPSYGLGYMLHICVLGLLGYVDVAVFAPTTCLHSSHSFHFAGPAPAMRQHQHHRAAAGARFGVVELSGAR